MASLKERAAGRWPEILTQKFGVSPKVLNGRHQPCPACGGEDRFRYKRDEHGGFFCGSTRGDGMDLVLHLTGQSFKDAAKIVEELVGRGEREERPQSMCERVLPRAKPITRSAYLEGRGITSTGGLLGIPDLEYWVTENDKPRAIGKYQALIVPMRRSGNVVALQAIYLQDGKKAPVPSPKKILPGHMQIKGASAHLAPYKGGWLGIAEGVETALSAGQLHGIPTWAALSTSGMASWIWPKNVEGVRIFADNDVSLAGHAAAWHLAHRLACDKIPVEVVMPPTPGVDWNDILMEKLKQ